jgi:hypothetical protein
MEVMGESLISRLDWIVMELAYLRFGDIRKNNYTDGEKENKARRRMKQTLRYLSLNHDLIIDVMCNDIGFCCNQRPYVIPGTIWILAQRPWQRKVLFPFPM